MRAAGLGPVSRGLLVCVLAVLLLHGQPGVQASSQAHHSGKVSIHEPTVDSAVQTSNAVSNGAAVHATGTTAPAHATASGSEAAVPGAAAATAVSHTQREQVKSSIAQPGLVHWCEQHVAANTINPSEAWNAQVPVPAGQPQPSAAATAAANDHASSQPSAYSEHQTAVPAAVSGSMTGPAASESAAVVEGAVRNKATLPSVLALLQHIWQYINEATAAHVQRACSLGLEWCSQAAIHAGVAHKALHNMRVSTRAGMDSLISKLGHAVAAGADAAGQYTSTALTRLQLFSWQVFAGSQAQQHEAVPISEDKVNGAGPAPPSANTCLPCLLQNCLRPNLLTFQQQDESSLHKAATAPQPSIVEWQGDVLDSSANDTMYCLLPADWYMHPTDGPDSDHAAMSLPPWLLPEVGPVADGAADLDVNTSIVVVQQCPLDDLQAVLAPTRHGAEQCALAQSGTVVPANQSVCVRHTAPGLYPVPHTLGQLWVAEDLAGQLPPMLRALQLPQQPEHVCGRFAVEGARQCIPSAVCCRVWSLEARLHNLPTQKAAAQRKAHAGEHYQVLYTDGVSNVLQMQQSLHRLRSRISAAQAAVRVWRGVSRVSTASGLWVKAQPAWRLYVVIVLLLFSALLYFHMYSIQQLRLRYKQAEEQARTAHEAQVAEQNGLLAAADSKQKQIQLQLSVTRLQLQKLSLSSKHALTASLAMQQALRQSLHALTEQVSEQRLFQLELQQLQKLHHQQDVQERNSIRDKMIAVGQQHAQHLQGLREEYKSQLQKQQAAQSAKADAVLKAVQRHRQRMTHQWLALREQQKIMIDHLASKAALMAQEQQARQLATEMDLANSQTQAAQLADALSEVQAQVADKEDMLAELQELMDERGEEVLQLQGALRAKEDQLVQVRALMDQLQENLLDVEERLNSSEAENDQLSQQLETAEERNVALLEKISVLEAKLTDSEKQVALLPQFEARMQQAASMLHGLLGKQAETESQLSETEEKLQEAQEQLEQTRRDLSAARAAAAARETELKAQLTLRGEELTRLQESKEKQAFLMGTDITALKEEIARLKAASKSDRKPRSPLPADAGILQALSCNTPGTGLR